MEINDQTSYLSTTHLQQSKNDPSNMNRLFFLEARSDGYFLVKSDGQTVTKLGFPVTPIARCDLCSCDDIVLVRHDSKYFLFNPFDATRHRSLEIPFSEPPLVSCGVCYDRVRDDHVVVAISSRYSKYAVYSYRRNSWTEKKKLRRHDGYYSNKGVCIDGKLYWLSFDRGSKLLDVILCFDPREDGFVELRLEHEDFCGYFAFLCDLRGQLCFCSYDRDEVRVRILVMKGPDNSWEKGIKISGASIQIPETSREKNDFFDEIFAHVTGSGRVKHQLNGLEIFREALVPSCNLLYPLEP